MQTRKIILEAAASLMNMHGVVNVSLRDVAKATNKSYGNITYHFATKDALLLGLFEAMDEALQALQHHPAHTDLFAYLLDLPLLNFEISTQYLFFTTDLVEIKRNHSAVFERIHLMNEGRRLRWRGLLESLQANGYFRAELKRADLDYLMLLSVSVRTFYLQWQSPQTLQAQAFAQTVNKLLVPYLTEKATATYERWYKTQDPMATTGLP